MVKRQVSVVALALLAAVTACVSPSMQALRPDPSRSASGLDYLARAHAHNDYAHSRPLLGALERGFASIEVDVVLSDGELLVAHALEEVRPSATLASLYLDPLRDVVRRNGGSVYSASGPPLQLLVDVKTEADATYRALHEVLAGYSDILTSWTEGVRAPGAVTAVVSGNRATGLIEAQRVRYVAIDGRILDDRSGMAAGVMPLVSASWEDMGPPERQARLRSAERVIERLHAEGREVRFWATPEDEELWRTLLAMGVDYIGTDDPRRLERLLRDFDDEAAPAAPRAID